MASLGTDISWNQGVEVMARLARGGFTSEHAKRLLSDETLVAKWVAAFPALIITEPKLETVTIAGYEFRQTTYADGSRNILLGLFELNDDPLATKIGNAGFVAEYSREHPDTYHGEITAENFPRPKEFARGMVRLSLLNTGKSAQDTKDFEALTKKLERAEGDVYQGLEVAKRYPNLQRELFIIMFGSRFRDQDGIGVAPVLHGDGDGRCRSLSLRSFGDDWRLKYWALVAG